MHLAGDDIPVFLRSFLNCYAIDILPNDGYIFNEHAVHGPPDKIFEEAAFLERFRNLLVMEDGDSLWLARATPRAWLEQGQKISREERADALRRRRLTRSFPTWTTARSPPRSRCPSRNPPKSVVLRFRHPKASPIKSVTRQRQTLDRFRCRQGNDRTEGLDRHGCRGGDVLNQPRTLKQRSRE